jgi:hypothetical protein
MSQARYRLERHSREDHMLLVLAIVLLLLFGALGFVAHLLWLGLILVVIVLGVQFFAGDAHRY